ncbi:hypothetical protein FRC03_004130 [Tulasnella sp. 419]|nr:hypothetical protein FRC03_004130 [Tulasnella sp. 419]
MTLTAQALTSLPVGSIALSQELENLLTNMRPYELEYMLGNDHNVNHHLKTHFSSEVLQNSRTSTGPTALPARLFARFEQILFELPQHLVSEDVVELRDTTPHIRHCVDITAKIVTGIRKSETPSKLASYPGQKSAKKTSTAPRKEAFKVLGEKIPTSPEEATKVLTRLLSSQQRLLVRYTRLFQSIDIAKYLKGRYFDATSSHGSVQPMIPATYAQDPSTHPETNSARITEFLEHDVGDLGDWPVIICTRAFRSLGSLRDDHRNVFDLAKRKIRELSHGYFPHYNQKKVAETEYGVPVFAANLTSKLRLIYAIDCSAIRSNRANPSERTNDITEMQRIRVYDVCLQGRLDKRLWLSLSIYLGKRGEDYRDRCLRRMEQRASDQGKMVIPPAIFEHASGNENTQDHDSLPMTETDYLNLHTIILLEKYIPYSHSLLDVVYNDGLTNQMFEVSMDEERIIFYPSSCFVVGRSGTGKTTTILYKMIGLEEAFLKSGTKMRQVFLTQSPVLARQVEEAFFHLWESSMATKGEKDLKLGRSHVKSQQSSLLDLDSETTDMSRLPKKFSDLQDHHFPLFLTFHQLCTLMERDIGRSLAHILTFEQFRTSLWDHFNEKLRRGLDSSLVFSEIIGIIKGHEMATSTNDGYLDRETYMSIRRRRFTEESYRSQIYDLFEQYSELKRSLDISDPAERTHGILRALKHGFPGVKFDYLYVDEAQDNLIIDSCLLRTLCKSPHGLFWAGDTAQTIAPGSNFRFNDLKALFFRMEEADPAVRAGFRTAVHPKFFQLVTNYRSHSGILRPASHVVQLLLRFYPAAIDSLAPEAGSTDGPKPLFVVIPSLEDGSTLSGLFTRTGKADIEFGAEQVVLVRNAESQKRLQRELGEGKGLVLTVYESKGLEFNDVLLYDFFADSTASLEVWRTVLEESENWRGHTQDVHSQHPNSQNTNKSRHAILERELKTLYVAVTRARKHLWIWDLSDKAKPMKDLWFSKEFIEERDLEDLTSLLDNGTSTPEEWRRKGQQFFEKARYNHAATCFHRAGSEWEESVAVAHQYRQEAQSYLASNPRYIPAWKKSAVKFKSCASSAPSDVEREGLLCRAAESWEHAKLYNESAELFIQARCYEDAIRQYRNLRNADKAISTLEAFGDLIAEEVHASTVEWARFEYTRQEETEKARSLFDDDDEHLKFLHDNKFHSQYLQRLVSLERYVEAAKIYLERDDGEPRAIELLLQADSSAAKVMLTGVVDRNLRRRFSYNMVPPPADASVKRYMDLAKSQKLTSDETELCEALWKQNKVQMIKLAQQHLNSREHIPHATLAYYGALKLSTAAAKSTNAANLEQLLTLYSDYLSLQPYLRGMVASSPGLKRLFNYRESGVSGKYEVGQASYLYSRVKEHPRATTNMARRVVTIKGEYLGTIIGTVISNTISDQLRALHNYAQELVRKRFLSGRQDQVQGCFGRLWQIFDSYQMINSASYWLSMADKCINDVIRKKDSLKTAFSPEQGRVALLYVVPVHNVLSHYLEFYRDGLSTGEGCGMDMVVAIRCVEGLVGYLIVKNHICQGYLHRDASTIPESVLHNLILPPTWFCATLPNHGWPRWGDWEAGRNVVLAQYSALVDIIGRIISKHLVGNIPSILHSPPEAEVPKHRLAFSGKHLGEVSEMYRVALLAHLTYALVYLASNIRDEDIHERVVTIIQSIPSNVLRCFNRFSGAEDLKSMIQTLRAMPPPGREAPVRLFYGQGPLTQSHTLSGLKCIRYMDNYELLEKMWKLAGYRLPRQN